MCDWRLSHLRRLILVTYASSQWRGKKFLIEHVVNVKTVNDSEHDGRSFKRWYGCYAFTGGREHFIFFFIEIENFRGNFFWKNSWFLQNFRRERTVFHFILKENGKSEAVFQHFWSARRKYFLNVVWLKYDHFFIAKLIICLVWIKKIA